MKTNIFSIRRLIVGTVLLSLLVPSLTLAQDRQRPADGLNICDNLDELRDQAQTRRAERAAKMKERHAERVSDFKSHRDDRRTEIEEKRTKREGDREERYAKLRDRATTDGQEEAVEEFIDTIKALVETRMTAVDAAIEAFEDGVEALREERNGAADDFAADVEAAIDAIFDEAEAMCEDEAKPADVRAGIKAGFESMRADFQARRAEYSFRDDFKALADARKAAIAAARDEFRTGYQAAKEELKAAFTE